MIILLQLLIVGKDTGVFPPPLNVLSRCCIKQKYLWVFDISNSSCISLPQNGCKTPKISSCQLNTLIYAKWWVANRHSLTQILNSSIFCHLWKKLVRHCEITTSMRKIEKWVSNKGSTGPWDDKNEATVRGKSADSSTQNQRVWFHVVKDVFSSATSLLCQLHFWKWLHSKMSDPMRKQVLIFATMLNFPSSNWQKLRDASQSHHFILYLWSKKNF